MGKTNWKEFLCGWHILEEGNGQTNIWPNQTCGQILWPNFLPHFELDMNWMRKRKNEGRKLAFFVQCLANFHVKLDLARKLSFPQKYFEN
jgi:hypothetical protein